MACARLWRRLGGHTPAGVVMLALALGGCSYQLDSLVGKGDAEPVGSLLPGAPGLGATLPPEHDLAVARAAVSELLSRDNRDASVPWENPRTGARGTITPIASSYSQDGFTCRDFLASYVRDGSESWMQGEACRIHQGKWQVRNLKPWRRTKV
jgi:surface antigen